jgi:tRNA U34 2-thiouridine synthase MnmA/TrmU
MDKTKALALLSGGLDSVLAVCTLMEQGIGVTGVTFASAFFGSERARRASEMLGIELIVEDISEEHLALVKDPPHGFGKCMNPCIDCHAMMVKKAFEMMRKLGLDLVATGEVLGERPMSQNRQSLDVVERESGAAGLLLRPLSARLLPPTRPELDGLVDRERLHAIEGRSRKPQMALAERYGIRHYEQPAGGCLLTDPRFSDRLRELIGVKPKADLFDVDLLKVGRHFRLPSGSKVIVGRDEEENKKMMSFAGSRGALLISDVVPGPVVFLDGDGGADDMREAAVICASFADNQERDVEMQWIRGASSGRIAAGPVRRSNFDPIRI